MTNPCGKFPWFLLLFTLLLLGADLYLSFTNPVTAVAQKLGLGRDIVRLTLSISFTGPIFAAFFLGSWSFLLLFKQKESRLFAQSILVLTLVLMVGVVLGVIRAHFFFNDTYGMYKVFTIIINYIYSFGYLISFGLLFLSTKKLLVGGSIWSVIVSLLITILIGTFYCVILLTNPDRGWTTTADIKPSHFLPDSLIILTIILPTILGWFLAIWSAFRLADIYGLPALPSRQEALKQTLYGVFLIIFSVIILESILSVGTTRFIQSSLAFILAIIYIFVAILAIGNFLVLKGSRKLIQSEST